ncbi:MAG: DEAD/DEAH box helicase family protein [Planctomycetia bacterium]|nr:DEAD/DEAH box helicase family protein [Planctomycetia bacterium]
MQLQFKTQDFQVDAAEAICKIFQGQAYQGGDTSSYRVDQGNDPTFFGGIGYRNAPISLSDEQILTNLRNVQIDRHLKPSESLAVNAPGVGKPKKKRSKKATVEESPDVAASGAPEIARKELKYNFTVEMETGVGKTYTYIKTMHELYRRYGWRKFIVVVPSVAIREGVYKSFQIMREHFQEQYAKSPEDDRPGAIISPCFIYNSGKLEEIQSFAASPYISVMIINAQAFNTREKASGVSLRIYERLDNFGSRRPIDLIAATNPILIIDEPQSVEGEQTREMLRYFNPLMTLRYSATPKEQYDLVYRLSAIDAYNKKLVKKIAVKGIHESNVSPTGAYVYLESINLSESAPTATLEIYDRKASKPRFKKNLKKGADLYQTSNEYEGYKGYVIESIDGLEGVVRFLNGVTIRLGEVVGKANEEQLRRIQIRETIESHLEKERELYRAVPGVREGVKVLSLFFIDEVAKYRDYDDDGKERNGVYAQIFEEEYDAAVASFQAKFGEEPYLEYLRSIETNQTHVGYFSIDKKNGRLTNSKSKGKRKGQRAEETGSDDVDAYDLIMKDKERLLELDAKRSPARFIFSHSALREGWDNPNVFQICTLKQSASETRKRQEVGRGMRLCVDQSGKRLDFDALGDDVQRVNKLTVITNESYADYVDALQTEIADASPDIPKLVTSKLFEGKVLHSNTNPKRTITINDILAEDIVQELKARGYVDSERKPTEAFYYAVKSRSFQCDAVEKEYVQSVSEVLNSIYKAPEIENDKGATVEISMNPDQFKRREFIELWERINAKTYYLASFDSEEVIEEAIKKLNKELKSGKSYYQVRYGEMTRIESKEALVSGNAFEQTETHTVDVSAPSRSDGGVKYDLVGKLADATCMTRREIVKILEKIDEDKLKFFQNNPEQFIEQAARLINEAKVTAIVEHISVSYRLSGEKYGCNVLCEPIQSEHRFTAPYLKTGDRPFKKHLYTRVLCDSQVEQRFAEDLESAAEVVVYVKLPRGFYIPTPYGKYNPDWAIAFDENADVKHIYFVAETKGSTDSCNLRPTEDAKIKFAKKHFDDIVKDVQDERRRVQYEEVTTYEDLLKFVKGAVRSEEPLVVQDDSPSLF